MTNEYKVGDKIKIVKFQDNYLMQAGIQIGDIGIIICDKNIPFYCVEFEKTPIYCVELGIKYKKIVEETEMELYQEETEKMNTEELKVGDFVTIHHPAYVHVTSNYAAAIKQIEGDTLVISWINRKMDCFKIFHKSWARKVKGKIDLATGMVVEEQQPVGQIKVKVVEKVDYLAITKDIVGG